MTTKNAGGYKSHLEGSRKGRVHQLHDQQGADAAWTLGLRLKLKPNTLRSWFATWAREKKKPARKAAA